MNNFVREHYIYLSRDFLPSLCNEKGIVENILKHHRENGINISELMEEKKEVFDLYNKMEQDAKIYFKDCWDDLQYYFGNPENNPDYGPLISFVMFDDIFMNYRTERLFEADFSSFEKYITELSDNDYLSCFGSTFIDYQNNIVKTGFTLENPGNVISIIELILNSELPDNLKWTLQDILLNREKHQEKCLKLFKLSTEFLKKYEKPLEKISKTFFTYWNKITDYNTFIKEQIAIFSDFTENPYGYILTPCFFSNNVSVIGDIDLDTREFHSPLELKLSVIFGETVTPKMMLGGDDSLTNAETCTNVLKQISDKSRFDILLYIKEKSAFGGEIAKHLGLSTATVSHHMNSLCDAGLININARDNRIYYSINKKTVEKCITYLEQNLL